MFRIRFHGRGGQGMKTASRILGTALFQQGYEVQDAPRYGAERRGAPIFAYVRAAKAAIHERGIIRHPDLVVVADDTLVAIPAAGVLAGIDQHSVLFINSATSADAWRQRLKLASPLLTLPLMADVEDRAELPYAGAAGAGAAAALLGVIPPEALSEAIASELGDHGIEVVTKNQTKALQAFETMTEHAGLVTEGGEVSAHDYADPAWVELPFDPARISAPIIHAGLTSVEVKTGLWRTLRPLIDYERCNKCWWVCSSFCPDSAIQVAEDGTPKIDYDHCKGCMVCVAQCPPHAITAIPEQQAQTEEST